MSTILTIVVVHLLAVVSPGPDFIVACRNSIVYSRKTGIYTAIGFALGIAVHVFYSLAGLALIISKSILLFNTIKYLGSFYLIYIGIKSFMAKGDNLKLGENKKKEDISKLEAIKIGFLTNVLNPKATLFFLSLFTLVVSPETPMYILLTASFLMIFNTFLWFSLVSVFISQGRIKNLFQKYQSIFNKSLGSILIALGIKVGLTEK